SPRLSLLRIPHYSLSSFFFFTDTAPTEIYTLSLHELFRSAPRHPVHGAAGRPGYRARPLERPARRRGRRPDHRPDGRGYREPDRVLRQHRADARPRVGRVVVRRTPRAGAGRGSRRLRARRGAVRPDRPAATGDARTRPHAGLPGGVERPRRL